MKKPLRLAGLGLLILGMGRLEAQTPASGTPGGRYELVAGDRLQYRIAEDPATGTAPLQVAVNSVGEASFPISRDSDVRLTLPVRGKSLDEVKQLLVTKLLEEYYNKATVELTLDQKTVTPGKVQFFGEMTGTLPLSPDQPPRLLSDAVLQLGVPEFADLRRIKVHRVDPVTHQTSILEVDVRAILREGKRDKDVVLQDGDRVEVRQKLIN